MLVLSRKVNETIIINDNIVITVVDIRGDKVRLAIEHPREMPVHRREVLQELPGETGEHLPDIAKYSGEPTTLVLSRKTGESIVIASVIVVTIVDIRDDIVRLGVECPKDLPIHRSEVWDAIQREKAIESPTETHQADLSPTTAQQTGNPSLDQPLSHTAENYEKAAAAVTEESDQQEPDPTPITGPLRVYIDSFAYSPDEKGELLSLFSELYQLQCDDRLVIDQKGMADPVFVEAIGPDGRLP